MRCLSVFACAAAGGSMLAMIVGAAAQSPSQNLMAIHPGVMCKTAQAVLALTLPGGGSRDAVANAPPRYLAIKDSGGCIDFPAGTRVGVQVRRGRTSTVTAEGRTFVVANIDFQAAGAAPAAAPVVAQPPSAEPAAAATSQASVPAHPPDIQDLMIGMPYAQAEAYLRDRHMDVRELAAASGKAGAAAVFAGLDTEAFLIYAMDGQVWYIGHDQTFLPNGANPADLLDAIESKYGKPSVVGGSGAALQLSYVYGADWHSILSDQNKVAAACFASLGSVFQAPSMPADRAFRFFVPDSRTPAFAAGTCHQGMQVSTRPLSPGSKLISGYEMYIYDGDIFRGRHSAAVPVASTSLQ